MEMAAEVLSGILSKIGEYLLEATVHQAGYICRFRSNVEGLMKEDENLTSAFENVQRDVETAKSRSDEIEKDVQKWLTDVEKVKDDVKKLEEEKNANKTCLGGCCPNWGWQYRLSKQAQETRSIVLELLQRGKFTIVSRRASLPGIEFVALRDFATFESRKSTFDQVIEALRDDEIRIVGIHGMGGVGKTTLAKEVGKKVKELNIFDKVVLATVSQTPNFKNIQAQIADLLGLKLDEESEDGRAGRLWMSLKNENKILIILDDVWEKIDLTNTGILWGNDHKGCKILLTTRQTHVCTRMGCERKIPLNVLKEEEGLALLKTKAGICDDSPLNALAKEVAGECNGLPLAIVTVGSALNGKAIDDWKLFNRKLKNSKFVDVDDVDKNIYACLKSSYDYLRDEDTKFCFLLCSLFPEDFEIPVEELVRYGRGIGLFKDANSIEEARSQVRVVVNTLKASALLSGERNKEFVKMHDVVRDVALWISSKQEKKFMSKADSGLTKWPTEEGLEQCAAISLMHNEIKVLPVRLECPKLEILLLDCYHFRRIAVVEVPDLLFVEMKALRVFSLAYAVVSLKSLQFLGNIRSLQLHNCTLKDISSIGALRLLEIVSFRRSRFDELPKEFGELSKLRLLKIWKCPELEKIHSNVIHRLSQLEELYIGPNSIIWAAKRTGEEKINNASLFELNSLSHLGTLSLAIDYCWIPKDFAFPKLRRYKIIVNPGYIWLPFLEECESDRMGCLKIAHTGCTSLIAFKELYETLQYLELSDLPELTFIWKDWSKPLSLRNLTDVHVSRCPRLTSCIFTVSLARSLVQLKVLRVSKCRNLIHIVNIAEEDGQQQLKDNLLDQDGCGNCIVLPKLQELSLYGLKSLISFCPQNYNSTWPALEILQIKRSSNLSPLFIAEELVKNLRHVDMAESEKLVFQELSFPSLKELELESLNLPEVPAHIFKLQSLSTLTLRSCPRLRHICSTTLARNLLQLEVLYIQDCQELEQIIVEDDEKDQTSLSSTDHLQRLCFPNHLSEFRVHNCRKLKSLFPIAVARNLSQLENLCIIRCPELEQIITEDDEKSQTSVSWTAHLQPPCFPNLSQIIVNGCHKLKSLFPVTVARNLFRLEELYITDCPEMEQIIVEDGDKECKEITLRDVLNLSLDNLPSLVNFCPVGHHFVFPSLGRLLVRNCPKMTTRISVAQNGTVHVQGKAEAPQEDVIAESPVQSTAEICCFTTEDIRRTLPPYTQN